ncbi:solute carrier family 2, facilitated glucose transporter member 1-like [Anneissia japonica]|uniref:solute carrier family 2, facilitated glucose transporter member 1-like n=1 Tax=Anneissia japonica TaxID=1529436 RepID=UPI001425AFD8|nr:solute carrier family 2, facilitated glucose transporter member 1-like [Anneissia japonica]
MLNELIVEETRNANQDYHQSDRVDDDGRITPCLVIAALAAGLGSSLQYGYNISVMTGISAFVQEFYNQSYYLKNDEYLTDNQLRWLWATTIAIYCVGGSCGSLVAVYSIYFFGSIIYTLLENEQCMHVRFGSPRCRSFFISNNIFLGIVIATVPVYLSEISPVWFRGGITSFHQLGVSFGLLLGQVLGLYAFYSEEKWQFALFMPLIINWVGGCVLYFCPESPRWILLNQSKPSRAQADESTLLLEEDIHKVASRKALVKLRGTLNVEGEIAEMLMERSLMEGSIGDRVDVIDLITLKNPVWKWPLIISIVLISNQQLGGINAIMYYTTEVFTEANLNEDTVRLATVGTGVITVVMAAVTVLNVDRLGRRFFLMSSYSVMAVAALFLSISLTSSGEAWSYMSIVFVYLFIFGFAPGPGAMTFVVIPELWTQGPRPTAMSFTGHFNWWTNFTVGLAFPFMLNAMGGYSFLIFTIILVLTVLFTYCIVPETKNKTFTEIVSSFRQNRLTSSRKDFIEDNTEQ